MFKSHLEESLPLILFKGSDGLSQSTEAIETYETSITFGEFADYFSAELNSDEDGIEETTKIQRDITKVRTDSILKYLKTRTDYSFPGIILVVSELGETKPLAIQSSRTLVSTSIPATSQRAILDGQGRHSAICRYQTELLENGDLALYNALRSSTLSAKLVVCNSAIHEPSTRSILRQVFSDLHLKLRKPNTSLNLYFDSKNAFNRLIDTIAQKVTVNSEGDFSRAIARNGALKNGKLWKYTDLAILIERSMGLSKARFADLLEREDDIQKYGTKISMILAEVMSHLPSIAPTKLEHDSSLYTKTLFVSGLGYCIRSSIECGDISRFSFLSTLPLSDKTDPLWQESGIMMHNAAGNLTIVRGSDKRIGLMLCERCGIEPTQVLRSEQ